MLNRRRLLQQAALSSAFLGLTPLLATPVKAPPLKVLKFAISNAGVGRPPRVGNGLLDVVQSQRYLEQEFAQDGIEIQWIFFKGQGPATNEALSNQQVDFASQGALPSLIGRSAGLDTRVLLVSGSRSNTYVGVAPDAPFQSVADLKGRRIAFNKGTASHLSAARILSLHGLTERDVRVVNLEPGAALAAFLSGDIDAIFGTLTLLALKNQQRLRILFDTRSQPIATAPGNILVRQAFADAYPEITQRVVSAMVRAAHWASDEANRERLFQLWAESGYANAELYAEEYAGLPLKSRLTPLLDPFILAREQQAAEDALAFKLIRKPVDIQRWLNPRYLDRALQDLALQHHWPRFDADGNPIA